MIAGYEQGKYQARIIRSNHRINLSMREVIRNA